MDFRLEHLDQLTVTDLEEYMEYLKYRFNENNKEMINKERGIMRKISSLKSFYNYFFRVEKIKTNPAALVRRRSFMIKKSSVWISMRLPCF